MTLCVMNCLIYRVAAILFMFLSVCLYMHSRWRYSYQQGRVGIPLMDLIPPQCCVCLKPIPRFVMSYFVAPFVFSVSLREEVFARFVDINETP